MKINIAEIIGKGYASFWNSKKRYRVVKGGKGSKKSTTTAFWFIYNIMKQKNANMVVVRNIKDTARDSTFAQLKWAARKLGVFQYWKFTTSPLEAIYLPTGQKILFRGFDDPLKLASITVDVGVLCWVWLEEAFEIESEEDFTKLDFSIRGEMPDGLFPQLTLTFNPWVQSHWTKKRFFDNDDPDAFTQTSTYHCNEFLSDEDRAKMERLAITNPELYKVIGLGEYGSIGGTFFEEFRKDIHVIPPFEVPREWKIYAAFDWGYSKPFAMSWFAMDGDGRLYNILELYGCTDVENTGVKWEPNKVFSEIAKVEEEHRWLKGKQITRIADPSIWNRQTGESIADTAEKHRVYFEKGDNKRIPGWMQVHYRMAVDDNNIPMVYFFNTCRHIIRTLPILQYSTTLHEDLDTDGEDHLADALRYLSMYNPIPPQQTVISTNKLPNPLDDEKTYDRYGFYRNN